MCRHALTELYDIDYTKYKLLQTYKKRTCHTLLFVHLIKKCHSQWAAITVCDASAQHVDIMSLHTVMCH